MVKILSSVKTATGVLKGITPGQLIIQFTNQCNAACPQCGMNKGNKFSRSTLRMDEVKRIIDAAAQKGVKALSFTGGEPLLYLNEVAELLKHAGQAGIEYTRTGTNGFFFANPGSPGFEDRVKKVAETLADTPLRNFWISVDSHVAEYHEKMRGFPGLVKGMEKAVPIFHEFGIYPAANLGINRNTGGDSTASLFIRPETTEQTSETILFYSGFKTAFEKFYRFVNSLGFTMANTCYPMSVNQDDGQELSAVYAATSPENITGFNAMEKSLLFQALAETISKYRPVIRIFSPVASLMALHGDYSNGHKESRPCLGGIDYFFVDAEDGNTYPCGFRGNENMGKFYDLDIKQIDRNPSCRSCDWECFRDPSELVWPFMQMIKNPFALAGKWMENPTPLKNWFKDLAYYRACGYFNGRQAPEYVKMAKFAKPLWQSSIH
ncbi:MAG: radical SAM protein [Desulfatibacillum sp.]|nr:radical SAM protein [Desulfatibacillum sp.]